MFNCSIEKSFKYDCIEIFIPVKCVYNDLLVLISHGSGGVGAAEHATAEFFLQQGYIVGINNYFGKHNIQCLFWAEDDHVRDEYDVSFAQMLTDIDFPNYKIAHIGFSLGGFLGLLNVNRFVRNYCFYPGILGMTSSLIEKDYSNTTTFLATQDNWTKEGYDVFESLALAPPTKVECDAHHGFMIPDKNREIFIAKYNLPKRVMKETEFAALKPNHFYLSKKYGHYMETILLQSNEKCSILALDKITQDLNEYCNNLPRT
jgi:dienelactone hydrolase